MWRVSFPVGGTEIATILLYDTISAGTEKWKQCSNSVSALPNNYIIHLFSQSDRVQLTSKLISFSFFIQNVSNISNLAQTFVQISEEGKKIKNKHAHISINAPNSKVPPVRFVYPVQSLYGSEQFSEERQPTSEDSSAHTGPESLCRGACLT